MKKIITALIIAISLCGCEKTHILYYDYISIAPFVPTELQDMYPSYIKSGRIEITTTKKFNTEFYDAIATSCSEQADNNSKSCMAHILGLKNGSISVYNEQGLKCLEALIADECLSTLMLFVDSKRAMEMTGKIECKCDNGVPTKYFIMAGGSLKTYFPDGTSLKKEIHIEDTDESDNPIKYETTYYQSGHPYSHKMFETTRCDGSCDGLISAKIISEEYFREDGTEIPIVEVKLSGTAIDLSTKRTEYINYPYRSKTIIIDKGRSYGNNCYIITKPGVYSFPTVMGRTSEPITEVSSAEVLWESFGTEEKPKVGDLIAGAKYTDNTIKFLVPDKFKEGNAVIAAKDSTGSILWSWHIWLLNKEPGACHNTKQEGNMWDGYKTRTIGVVMDRDLGAIQRNGAGLMYQWGRKDPFLGISDFHNKRVMESTIGWPSAVHSTKSTGTIEYATAHPTTFITGNEFNGDWYYTGTESTNNAGWHDKYRAYYDPCPEGWHVPSARELQLFGGRTLTDNGLRIELNPSTYYPLSGFINGEDGYFNGIGEFGFYWSRTQALEGMTKGYSPFPYEEGTPMACSYAFTKMVYRSGLKNENPVIAQTDFVNSNRSYGMPIRCVMTDYTF